MNHDEFLATLTDAVSWSEGLPTLPAAAAAHSRECADCARLMESLAVAARDADALGEDVPADYWADFNARLARRLPPLQREASPRQEAPFPRGAPPQRKRSSWLVRLAAALLVGALVVIAWRVGHGSDAVVASRTDHAGFAATQGLAKAPGEILATMPADDVEAALAAFSLSGIDEAGHGGDDLLSPSPARGANAASGNLAAAADLLEPDEPGLGAGDGDGGLDGPVEPIEADLVDNMSEADRLEFLRRLHEASS